MKILMQVFFKNNFYFQVKLLQIFSTNYNFIFFYVALWHIQKTKSSKIYQQRRFHSLTPEQSIFTIFRIPLKPPETIKKVQKCFFFILDLLLRLSSKSLFLFLFRVYLTVEIVEILVFF